MPHLGKFDGGWMDSSVHDFVSAFHPSASTRYALITCLDSGHDLERMLQVSRHLQGLRPVAKILGRGMLVPTDRLVEADRRDRIFFGFDEVYFFREAPREEKPGGFSLVGPSRIDAARLANVVPWFERNGGSLALGDGDGMNFLVKATGLLRTLLAHSVESSGTEEPVLLENSPSPAARARP